MVDNGINNVVNQLNRDNPNSFENQFIGRAKETFNGEIIDLKVKDILNVVSNELSTDELITFYKGLNLISGNLEKFCQQYDKNKKTN